MRCQVVLTKRLFVIYWQSKKKKNNNSTSSVFEIFHNLSFWLYFQFDLLSVVIIWAFYLVYTWIFSSQDVFQNWHFFHTISFLITHFVIPFFSNTILFPHKKNYIAKLFSSQELCNRKLVHHNILFNTKIFHHKFIFIKFNLFIKKMFVRISFNFFLLLLITIVTNVTTVTYVTTVTTVTSVITVTTVTRQAGRLVCR